MKPINVAIIGTGWCGGIRAETCAASPLVKELHLAEVKPERLAEMARKTGARTATADYRELLAKDDIDAVMVSATPESTHYPMTRDALAAGKHVLLEKPIALTLAEADELIALASEKKLKLTIGYSQRFNPKFAYVRKCVREGTIGRPVSALVSRHINRNLGKKITGRVKLSPAAMESTHDLDFVLWCLEPAKPARVYSQVAFGAMQESTGAPIPDCQWITVTMDNGVSFVIGGGWSLPPGYPNYSSTWIEFLGTDGALFIDNSHRDVSLSTLKDGTVYPMSTMPGEQVEHVFAGAMANETLHFLEAVAYDRPVLVTAEHARMVMELYQAADLSAERNEAVSLPLAERSEPDFYSASSGTLKVVPSSTTPPRAPGATLP
ncbi:MAG TPA: Gfo/Idh/MocA family oxidoreductase [Burkholderiales bacterium]|nr:Gfo/Idh/MocA family oxidoreductase [Burkholderiales bacterium]